MLVLGSAEGGAGRSDVDLHHPAAAGQDTASKALAEELLWPMGLVMDNTMGIGQRAPDRAPGNQPPGPAVT